MLDERQPEGSNTQGLDIRPTPREEMNLTPLDSFPYEYVGKKIWVEFEIPEFTAICPFSDFPDFATIRLRYVPFELCVELKSLKLYIISFRDVNIRHVHAITPRRDSVLAACDPLKLEIEGDFNVRGNIKTVVKTSYKRDDD